MVQIVYKVTLRLTRVIYLSLLILGITTFGTGFSNSKNAEDEVKRVVVIHWQNAYADLTYQFDKHLRETLRSDDTLNIEIYTEYLQFDVLTDPEIQESTLELVEKKYKNLKIDVLITSEIFDANYIFEHRERIFPNVPLVYYKISETSTVNSEISKNTNGMILLSEIHHSIEVIQQLQPEIDKLLFIIGTGKTEASYHRVIKNTMLQYSEQYTCSYTIDMSYSEIINLVKTLPPHTAVFYTGLSRDSLGKGLNPGNALKSICKYSTAPVYVFSDAYFDYDVVGGYVFNVSEIAKNSGGRALAILHGEKVESLISKTDQMTHVFKADQLEKWQINKSDLPRGSIIINNKNMLDTSSNKLFLVFVFCIVIIIGLTLAIVYYKIRKCKV